MKKQLFYFVICLILVNCKETQPELTLKYSNQPIAIACDTDHSELFNEAIHSFESDITKFYTQENPNLNYAYNMFLKESTSNTANYNTISNEHALAIFEALKNVEGLWVTKNNQTLPNYNHKIYSCIGDHIQDKDLKTTYNALLTTNSMSIRMLKDVLIAKSSRLNSDKYLATFVALELYYSKLTDVDLSKKELLPADTTRKKDNDPHAGHNHD